jgi:hypothetical protein
MGRPTKKDGVKLEPKISMEPFEKLGLDFVGPIEPPSNKKEHILVFTKY